MFNSKMGTEFLTKMNRVADYFIISLLWFAFSIPLITMGAASSAMYRTVQTSVVEEKGEIYQTFWRSFKTSFFQATPIWLLYILIIFIFSLNQMLLTNNLANSWINQFSQIFIFMVIILCTPVLIYVLAYIGRFKDPLKLIVRNSSLMALTHFKDTLYIGFLFVVTALAIYLIPILVVLLPAFFIFKICERLESIFRRYQPA